MNDNMIIECSTVDDIIQTFKDLMKHYDLAPITIQTIEEMIKELERCCWYESIDELVDEKREELDAIYSRFNGPDATETDPLTLALKKQEARISGHD